MLAILAILYVTTIACGTVGSMLVVRNESMIADALSHSVLLGIVLAFFISHSLDSPLLVIGATIFGVITVFAIDSFMMSAKVNHDAATGVIFPFLFAIAVVLISIFARNVHLDMDMVLLGEIIFASLNTTTLFGIAVPISLIKSSLLLAVILLFFTLFYQKLQLLLFDPIHARAVGVRTQGLQIVIMLLVSLTTVISFDAVGSMTVICFMVAPAMTSLFWAKTFKQLLYYSSFIAIVSSTCGYFVAQLFDVTVSGTCTVIALLICCVSVLLKKLQSR